MLKMTTAKRADAEQTSVLSEMAHLPGHKMEIASLLTIARPNDFMLCAL